MKNYALINSKEKVSRGICMCYRRMLKIKWVLGWVEKLTFLFFRKCFSAENLPIVITRKTGEKKLKSVNMFLSRIELETYEKLQKPR